MKKPRQPATSTEQRTGLLLHCIDNLSFGYWLRSALKSETALPY